MDPPPLLPPFSLGGLSSDGAERIYRSSPAATDCNWSSSPTRPRASGPSVFSETGGGAASGGATGPMPKQPVILNQSRGLLIIRG